MLAINLGNQETRLLVYLFPRKLGSKETRLLGNQETGRL
jgi:hypothetical protein